MNHAEIAKAYKTFFLESLAGRMFMNELDRQIMDDHEHAEDNPDLCRDYIQRAKGVRNVRDYIVAATTEIKKGPQMRSQ